MEQSKNYTYKNVFLSLGGNEKNSLKIFEQTIDYFKTNHKLIKQSAVYSSEPWGFNETVSPFFNQVIQIETKYSPEELLIQTQKLEKHFGRPTKTKNEYESRPIDIDILIFDKKVINSQKLTIPHYLMHKRNFVLIPFNEIASDFLHPVFHKTINDLLLYSPDQLTVFKHK